MEERLLLDRIALDAANVAPRHVQPPVSIETDLAHANSAIGNRTLVTARVAAQTLAPELIDEFGSGIACASSKNLLKSSHVCLICTALMPQCQA